MSPNGFVNFYQNVLPLREFISRTHTAKGVRLSFKETFNGFSLRFNRKLKVNYDIAVNFSLIFEYFYNPNFYANNISTILIRDYL